MQMYKCLRHWIIKIKYSIWSKKTNFKIEFFECQEQYFLFEMYWLCKTHPRGNTASIKPKIIVIIIKITGSKWHLRFENSLGNVVLGWILKQPVSSFFAIFEHDYADRVDILPLWMSVRTFFQPRKQKEHSFMFRSRFLKGPGHFGLAVCKGLNTSVSWVVIRKRLGGFSWNFYGKRPWLWQ